MIKVGFSLEIESIFGFSSLSLSLPLIESPQRKLPSPPTPSFSTLSEDQTKTTSRTMQLLYCLAAATAILLTDLPVAVVAFWSSSPSFLRSRTSPLILSSGYGIATNYTWKEEAFDIEVTVRVPKHITSRDVTFAATPTSIALGYHHQDDPVQLLDPSRALRGRVNLDSTYWMLGEDDDTTADTRFLTVTIEKYIRTPKSDFDAVEFDWKGVYRDEEEGEVLEREYDQPEPLDVRDYAGRMGVDLDNLDMSMVDKTMFSSGLNVSQSALDEMREAGYLSKDQITQQKDGSEFTVDDETGEAVPYSLEKDLLPVDQQGLESEDDGPETKTRIHQQVRNFTRAAFAQDAAAGSSSQRKGGGGDPILELPISQLKEILKSQGLSEDGTESQLRERLRLQVNTLLQQGNVQ